MSNSQVSTQHHHLAVLGAGSFGTVIANILAKNGHCVHLWMRSERQQQELSRTRINSAYLPRYRLDSRLKPTTELGEAVRDAEAVFIAVPSKAFRTVVTRMRPCLPQGVPLISLTKGIEAPDFQLMSSIVQSLYPNHPVGVLSGPNLAKEMAQGHITATVIASADAKLRHQVQGLLSCRQLKVYDNPDVYGVELAGALKNIYAMACGMAVALQAGQNTQAMILTRSLAEMSRLAVHLGANPLTFIGLAGVGDLVVTCLSPLSRNYRIGYAIGQGYSLRQALKQLGETAEGVNTLKLVKAKADQLSIRMPLVQGLYAILFEQASVEERVMQQMLSPPSEDVAFMTQLNPLP